MAQADAEAHPAQLSSESDEDPAADRRVLLGSSYGQALAWSESEPSADLALLGCATASLSDGLVCSAASALVSSAASVSQKRQKTPAQKQQNTSALPQQWAA